MAKFVLSHLAHLFLEAGPNLDGLQSPLPPPLYFTSAAAASMKNISLVTLRLYAWKKPTEIKSTLVPTLFNFLTLFPRLISPSSLTERLECD
jgi:hypothetical protein